MALAASQPLALVLALAAMLLAGLVGGHAVFPGRLLEVLLRHGATALALAGVQALAAVLGLDGGVGGGRTAAALALAGALALAAAFFLDGVGGGRRGVHGGGGDKARGDAGDGQLTENRAEEGRVFHGHPFECSERRFRVSEAAQPGRPN